MTDILTLLKYAPFTVDAWEGANSWRKRLLFADGIRAIAKTSGQPNNDTKEHTPYKEEVVYIIAQLLSIGYLVPPTVTRQIGASVCSVQLWVDRGEDVDIGYDSKFKARRDMMFLDTVISNGDRHVANYLRPSPQRIVCVDHGITLPSFNGDCRSAHPYESDRLTSKHLAGLGRLSSSDADVRGMFTTMIGPAATGALFDRVNSMLAAGSYSIRPEN